MKTRQRKQIGKGKGKTGKSEVMECDAGSRVIVIGGGGFLFSGSLPCVFLIRENTNNFTKICKNVHKIRELSFTSRFGKFYIKKFS